MAGAGKVLPMASCWQDVQSIFMESPKKKQAQTVFWIPEWDPSFPLFFFFFSKRRKKHQETHGSRPRC